MTVPLVLATSNGPICSVANRFFFTAILLFVPSFAGSQASLLNQKDQGLIRETFANLWRHNSSSHVAPMLA